MPRGGPAQPKATRATTCHDTMPLGGPCGTSGGPHGTSTQHGGVKFCPKAGGPLGDRISHNTEVLNSVPGQTCAEDSGRPLGNLSGTCGGALGDLWGTSAGSLGDLYLALPGSALAAPWHRPGTTLAAPQQHPGKPWQHPGSAPMRPGSTPATPWQHKGVKFCPRAGGPLGDII